MAPVGAIHRARARARAGKRSRARTPARARINTYYAANNERDTPSLVRWPHAQATPHCATSRFARCREDGPPEMEARRTRERRRAGAGHRRCVGIGGGIARPLPAVRAVRRHGAHRRAHRGRARRGAPSRGARGVYAMRNTARPLLSHRATELMARAYPLPNRRLAVPTDRRCTGPRALPVRSRGTSGEPDSGICRDFLE